MTKKARIINKLLALSADEKKALIEFFTENHVYENRIDWNNKNLERKDFDYVLAMGKMSRKNRKNTIKMFEKYNCKIIIQTKEFFILVPLDWECAKFINSFNCGGEGATWCIGNKTDDTGWNSYIKEGSIFYFLYFFNSHPIFGKKLMIEIDNQEYANFFTQNDNYHCFELLANYLQDLIYF